MLGQVWHKLDDIFAQPKVVCDFELVSPVVYENPRTVAALKLFELSLDERLNKYTYDAKVNRKRARASAATILVTTDGSSMGRAVTYCTIPGEMKSRVLGDLPSSGGRENIQILFCETDELPHPRPTQPKKN